MRSPSVDPLPPLLPTLPSPVPPLQISTILAQGLLSNPQRKGRAWGAETDREERKGGPDPRRVSGRDCRDRGRKCRRERAEGRKGMETTGDAREMQRQR